MTLIIAHRGASTYEVENSLAAFRAARDLQADGVELDIHATADGVLVVYHDATVAGLPIHLTPFERLRNHTLPNGEPLPTLAAALQVLGPDLEVFVEIKGLAPDWDGELLETLDGGPAPHRYRAHAFDHRIVRRLRAARPSFPCAVLSCSYPIDVVAPMRDADVTELWQQESLVDAEMVRAVHRAGGQIFVWTVDDPNRMRALADDGVDGICTNKPDLAREILQ